MHMHVHACTCIKGAHGGSGTLLKFFSTPYDLRKLNEMGHLQHFIKFMRRSLAGEYNAASYLDPSGKLAATSSIYSVVSKEAAVRSDAVSASEAACRPTR